MEPYGILIIDKPIGFSSFDVIRKLRRICGIRKMGHSGTLDPFASGILPICIGKATRIAQKLINREKEYLTVMKLGERTDSGDCEGKIVETKSIEPLSSSLLEELPAFVLSLRKQKPPAYSALKINGKRAYQLARQNIQVDLPERDIKIMDFEIISYQHPFLTYRAKVSKGVYIRSLTETIAEFLGSIGTTTSLRRTALGKIDKSTPLHLMNEKNWRDYLISIPDFFSEIPLITVLEVSDFQNGKKIVCKLRDISEVMVQSAQGQFLGFAELKDEFILPRKVFI